MQRYGCAGCHEIAGMEDEGRIGTELTKEGSKPIEQIDFALLTGARSAVARMPNRSPTQTIWRGCPTARRRNPGTTTRDFSNTSSRNPTSTIKGQDEDRDPKTLRMPNPHLTKDRCSPSPRS